MAIPTTGNRQLMREMNTKAVLDLVRTSKGISQVAITNKTRLSSGTVTNIIKELKSRNFVEYAGQATSVVGRRPTLLRFNPEAGYVIAGGIFADETQVGIVDLEGRIKGQLTFRTYPENGYRSVFENFALQANRLLETMSLHRNRIWGVGVSVEGVVDPDKGTMVLCSRFGWRNVPIKDCIEECMDMQTFIKCDGEAMALGEYYHGSGKGMRDIVCIDVDAGIGSAAIYDGKAQRGAHGMAGEIGHTLMVPNGPTCKCGKKGCLEAVASGWAILSKIKSGLKEGRKSTISDEVHSHSTRQAVRAVFEAAKSGDEFALEVITQVGENLGLATAAIVNYADPELVIFTGCVIQESGGMVLEIIRRVVEEQVVDSKYRMIQIKEGALGKDACLIGAAAGVRESMLGIDHPGV